MSQAFPGAQRHASRPLRLLLIDDNPHDRELVTRALGIDPIVEPEIHDHQTLPGDIYLLCSDGLCDMVGDEDIGLALHTLSSNLKLCAQHLVQTANDNGGRDNISVILVRVLREFPASRGIVDKMMGWFR